MRLRDLVLLTVAFTACGLVLSAAPGRSQSPVQEPATPPPPAAPAIPMMVPALPAPPFPAEPGVPPAPAAPPAPALPASHFIAGNQPATGIPPGTTARPRIAPT